MTTPPLEKSARLCEEAPRDWVRASLMELLPLSYGKGLTAASRRTGEVPVYGSSGIVGWHDQALTSGPTVVVGRKGTAGAAFFSPGPCYPIDTVYFSEPAHVDGRLFTYLLNYLELEKLDQSTTIPSLSRERYDPIVIPVPGCNQQRRIAEKIDELFSQIEAGEQALARAQKLLERYRQSVLNAAVTGELSREWREQHKAELESGGDLLKSILQARRGAWEQAELATMHARGKPLDDDPWKQKYREPEPPDTTDLPALPEGWAWATLGALAAIVGGITVDAKRRGPDLREVPYLRVANVQRGRLDLSEVKTILAPPDKIEAIQLQYGDILLNEGGDRDKIGRGWIWEDQIANCIHQNHIFRARLFGQIVPPRFVSYYANEFGRQYFFTEGKQTTNLASINLTKVSLLPVPVPPSSEALRIVELTDEMVSVVDHMQAEIAKLLAEAGALRQAVLAAAFSGKLVTQHRADEPASLLLDRIREERAANADRAALQRQRGRGQPSRKGQPAMVKTRREINQSHLRDILRASNGGMAAEALWKASELDIDDFYKQLRAEVAAGHLREERDGNTSRIVCR